MAKAARKRDTPTKKVLEPTTPVSSLDEARERQRLEKIWPNIEGEIVEFHVPGEGNIRGRAVDCTLTPPRIILQLEPKDAVKEFLPTTFQGRR